MCAGAIVLARVPVVVFGVPDPKRGGAVSVFQILNHPNLNHRPRVVAGVLEKECRDILQGFFRARRKGAGVSPPVKRRCRRSPPQASTSSPQPSRASRKP